MLKKICGVVNILELPILKLAAVESIGVSVAILRRRKQDVWADLVDADVKAVRWDINNFAFLPLPLGGNICGE